MTVLDMFCYLLVFCFMSRLFDEVSQNNAEDLESLLTEVIGAIAKALQTRQMNDLHKPVVAGLQHLLTVKAVPSLVRSHPSFFGFDATRSDQSKPVDAFVLQHSSMLGHLLRPTSMDETEFVQVSLLCMLPLLYVACYRCCNLYVTVVVSCVLPFISLSCRIGHNQPVSGCLGISSYVRSAWCPKLRQFSLRNCPRSFRLRPPS